jgi:CHAD domain-containing protein
MGKSALKASPKKAAKKATSKKAAQTNTQALTWGEYAHAIIAKQYSRLVKQESGVLNDTEPESLHQMRVATRRLRTALQVFGAAIELPKPAREKHVQALTKTLGELRDLDVQMAALRETYLPQVSSSEQKQIQHTLDRLHKQRHSVFNKVEATLTDSEYGELKTSYEAWLEQPAFTPIAQISLAAVLPDLLSPLLAKLLVHPGWLIPAEQHSSKEGIVLHELRKTCKHARYQTEFFSDLYGRSFHNWVDELKQIQEKLGIVQDTHVLLELLSSHASDHSSDEMDAKADLPELYQAVGQERSRAMVDWDTLRAKYLDTEFRYSLHRMLLEGGKSS